MIAWLASRPLRDGDGVLIGGQCVHLYEQPGSHREKWIRWRRDDQGDWWALELCDECYRAARAARQARRRSRRDRRRHELGDVAEGKRPFSSGLRSAPIKEGRPDDD